MVNSCCWNSGPELARQHWHEGDDPSAVEALSRGRAILAELLSTVRNDGTDLAANVRNLYGFLLRSLIDVRQTRDLDELSDIIQVLQIERETWTQICRQMPESPGGHRFGRRAEVT